MSRDCIVTSIYFVRTYRSIESSSEELFDFAWAGDLSRIDLWQFDPQLAGLVTHEVRLLVGAGTIIFLLDHWGRFVVWLRGRVYLRIYNIIIYTLWEWEYWIVICEIICRWMLNSSIIFTRLFCFCLGVYCKLIAEVISFIDQDHIDVTY